MRHSYVIMILLGVGLFFGIDSAFGQIQNSITVTTDKISYSDGDTVLVTGEVRDLYGIPVSMIVKAHDGHLVAILQVTVGADKKFSTEMTIGEGTSMNIAGDYTITVQYGNESRTAQTTFIYTGGMAPPPNTVLDISFTNPRVVDDS